MMAAIDGLLAHVHQGVVHPTHVPFVGKAKAPGIGGVRHTGPGGGFLGQGDQLRAPARARRYSPRAKIHSFQVLAAAVLVGLPFPLFAGIIEIQHGSHGVHAQAVDMKLFQPI